MTFSIDQYRLDGKVAVVTGAGGRGNSIGRAYALGLAQAGAAVVVADLNAEGAKAVADEIVAAGGKAIAAQVDIADAAAVKRMAAEAKATFGGVDILVNNAALMVELGYQQAVDVPIEDWNKLVAVNVTGALNCVQALYGVSKLALLGLTTTLARQLGREKINVNAIAPGNVMSDAGKLLTPDGSPFIQLLEATVAMRVRGQPDELVGPLLLLCSQAGDWITGQTLHVDGGWVLRP
jgi:NAD(P)-dependent dehydrogenase (short-subunit alcohol dehydrogenase family)